MALPPPAPCFDGAIWYLVITTEQGLLVDGMEAPDSSPFMFTIVDIDVSSMEGPAQEPSAGYSSGSFAESNDSCSVAYLS